MNNLTGAIGSGPVAVIGAGPSGLTAAKHLIERGLEPIVLERGEDVGGQWNVGSPHSGVWPGMRTNTSRTTTAFSDFPLRPGWRRSRAPAGAGVPARVFRALRGSAARRTGARVTGVERAGRGWIVRWSQDGEEHADRFTGVVVASGRFQARRVPRDPGSCADAG